MIIQIIHSTQTTTPHLTPHITPHLTPHLTPQITTHMTMITHTIPLTITPTILMTTIMTTQKSPLTTSLSLASMSQRLNKLLKISEFYKETHKEDILNQLVRHKELSHNKLLIPLPSSSSISVKSGPQSSSHQETSSNKSKSTKTAMKAVPSNAGTHQPSPPILALTATVLSDADAHSSTLNFLLMKQLNLLNN